MNNWDQFTVTWNTQPPFSPTPFSPMWDSAEYISSSTELGLLTIDITDLVKGWIDGSIPNNGILLAGNEMVNDLMAFRSTNYLNSNEQPMLAIKYVEGILETYETQEITIPTNTDNPIAESDPITLGPREKATFMVWNTSDSANVSVKVQVGFENSPDQVFFDAGHWFNLEPEGYPGEALALSTTDAANYARVLVRGEGGETVIVYPLTKEV